MKAKEYFEQCKENNLDKSPDWRIIDVFRQMVLEVQEIAKQRNARFDKALISIFNEQNQKANAFIKLINGEPTLVETGFIRLNAFRFFLVQHDPHLASLIGWSNNTTNDKEESNN